MRHISALAAGLKPVPLAEAWPLCLMPRATSSCVSTHTWLTGLQLGMEGTLCVSLLPGSHVSPAPLCSPWGDRWALPEPPSPVQPETLSRRKAGAHLPVSPLGVAGPTAWLPVSENWCFMYFPLGVRCFSWKGISGLFHFILGENKSPISLFLMLCDIYRSETYLETTGHEWAAWRVFTRPARSWSTV